MGIFRLNRWFWFVIALTTLSLTGWWLVQPGEVRTDYCADCACEHSIQTWVLRGSNRVLWERETIRETPVSSVMVTRKLVAPHAHRWIAPSLIPNPLNPYQAQVKTSLAFINTSLVAAWLGNISEYADPQSVRHACEVVLAPEYSYLINHDLRFHKFPPHGFRDRTQFLRWWQQNAYSFFDHLRDETVPD